jgi:putative thioredoxin
MIETIESDYIHDGNADNFSALVIDNSKLGPVLVNFWASTAGPCLRQYPILDKLVHEYNGRVLLINIDTEKEVLVSRNYGIASVPTIKLIRFGEVVATLHGYQSESELRKIVDRYVSRDSDIIIEQAIQEYSQGKQSKSYQLLSDAIIGDPVNPRLPLTVGKLLKHEKRYDEAFNLLSVLPPELQDEQEITFLLNQLFFLKIIDKDEDIESLKHCDLSDRNDLSQIQKLSAFYVMEERYEFALQQLEKIINQGHDFDDEYARKAMLKIFKLIDNDNKLVQQYRPLLLKYSH